MARVSSINSSLHEHYSLHLQIGLALSLALVLTAAQWPTHSPEPVKPKVQEQETVDLRQVQPTRHEKTPPAPPKPPVPQAVPNNEVIGHSPPEFEASLDLNTALAHNSGPSSPSTTSPSKAPSQTDEVFIDVQRRPDCGGLQSLKKKIRYPPSARAAGLQGRVFVQFIVNEKGQVTKPRVVRSAHKMLNQAALRAVKRLTCTPGKQRSRPVKVKMTMPVIFALNGKS